MEEHIPLPVSVRTTENVVPAEAITTRSLLPACTTGTILNPATSGQGGWPAYRECQPPNKGTPGSTTHLSNLVRARRPH